MRKADTTEDLSTNINKKQDYSEEQSIVLSKNQLMELRYYSQVHCDDFCQFSKQTDLNKQQPREIKELPILKKSALKSLTSLVNCFFPYNNFLV